MRRVRSCIFVIFVYTTREYGESASEASRRARRDMDSKYVPIDSYSQCQAVYNPKLYLLLWYSLFGNAKVTACLIDQAFKRSVSLIVKRIR